MSTFNPSAGPGQTYYYSCPPDAFAVFKRGDRALCLKGWESLSGNEWVLSGGVPRTGVVYTVRDYHFGNSVSSRPDLGMIWGQILHLDGIVCGATPHGPEMGWFHGVFRKLTEEEARQAMAVAEPAALEDERVGREADRTGEEWKEAPSP